VALPKQILVPLAGTQNALAVEEITGVLYAGGFPDGTRQNYPQVVKDCFPENPTFSSMILP